MDVKGQKNKYRHSQSKHLKDCFGLAVLSILSVHKGRPPRPSSTKLSVLF